MIPSFVAAIFNSESINPCSFAFSYSLCICLPVPFPLIPQFCRQWEVFTYLLTFLGNSVHLQVRPMDRFSHFMAQTTQTRVTCERVCLWGIRWYYSPFNGSNSPKPRFLEQAKSMKNSNFHIFETTASIATIIDFPNLGITYNGGWCTATIARWNSI